MPPEQNSIERRKDYRLPYQHKIIYSDGKVSKTAYAGNLSRGGFFLLSLDPHPIGSILSLTFMLSNHPTSLTAKGKVAHIKFDRQRCEVDCGMGIQFEEISDAQLKILNQHILNEKMAYLELKNILAPEKPNLVEVDRYLNKIPSLKRYDLLMLRYKVNRVCTIFEPEDPMERAELAMGA